MIVLTARGSEDDRVRGLALGADDYVVKPFRIKELLARIEAVLRRAPARDRRRCGDLLSRAARPTSSGTRSRSTTASAASSRSASGSYSHYLACHAGRAVSRDELLARVWGLNPAGITTRTIDMHIARLREKLHDDKGNPRIVLTVRGQGYMLAAGRPA